MAKRTGPMPIDVHRRMRAFTEMLPTNISTVVRSQIEAGGHAIRGLIPFMRICKSHKLDPNDIMPLGSKRMDITAWLSATLGPAKQLAKRDPRFTLTDSIRVVEAARKISREMKMMLMPAIEKAIGMCVHLSDVNKIPLSLSVKVLLDFDGDFTRYIKEVIDRRAEELYEVHKKGAFIPYDCMVKICLNFKNPESAIPKITAVAAAYQRGRTWAEAVEIAINHVLKQNGNA